MNKGAVYFQHSVEMRNDRKVRAIRSKFDVKGYGVLCMLLECIAKENEFALTFDDMEQKLIAADFGIDVSELTAIVAMCAELGLITNKDGKLQSNELNETLAQLTELRKQKSESGKLGAAKRWNKETPGNDTGGKHAAPDKSKGVKYTDPDPVFPYAEIGKLWNNICGDVLGKVDPDNVVHLLKIEGIKDIDTRYNIKTPEKWLESAAYCFRYIISKPFLCGKGKRGWKASLQWIFKNSDVWQNIKDDKYRKKETQKR